MFIDAQQLFSDSQVVTASANSTNVMDLKVARDVGIGESSWIFILVTEAMTDAGGDSTVTVSLITDDNAALSSESVVQQLVVIPASTAAGTLYVFPLPAAVLNEYEQYIGLDYTVTGGNLTTGKFTAGLVKDIQHVTNYASGYSVA